MRHALVMICSRFPWCLVPWFPLHSKQKTQNEGRGGKMQSAGKIQRPKCQASSSLTAGHTTEQEFADLLAALHTCDTFEELQQKCRTFIVEGDIMGTNRSIDNDKLLVDCQALKIFPLDVPGPRSYPATVRADGDCLPGCGSVYAFGSDQHPAEIRVHIVHELALHEEYYLTEDNLRKGHSRDKKHKVKNSFRMYSEEYLPGIQLNEKTIRTVFEHEVMKISKQKTYMGIWQIFALASVLKRPVFSAYPCLGNPTVRADLHRLVLPRLDPNISTTSALDAHDDKEVHQTPLVVMWTSTRNDMTNQNWVPNHFVPAVPQTPIMRTQSKP